MTDDNEITFVILGHDETDDVLVVLTEVGLTTESSPIEPGDPLPHDARRFRTIGEAMDTVHLLLSRDDRLWPPFNPFLATERDCRPDKVIVSLYQLDAAHEHLGAILGQHGITLVGSADL